GDWSADELRLALELALILKQKQHKWESHRWLLDRTLVMIFDKPSMRTRVSFGAGMVQLGGLTVQLDRDEIALGERETVRDAAAVLSRYADGIMIRTSSQAVVDELAHHSDIPVINGLTDDEHPCQALADVMTIAERLGSLEGKRIAYLGDGNNVCSSLMIASTMLGASVAVATPAGYEPDPAAVETARRHGEVELTDDPRAASTGAHVLYTDVWTSMGHEAERERRLRDFQGYGIRDELVALTAPGAIVMHDLPAHYGEEITEEILHGPRSAVWDQAENRLHAQKAVLALVMR
ncbi:MAG: ornithine carbamoyltransferase, partial [Gaiellaceae bacterium]|nr:ornithine carbamoyltransferase [Gaiellaceae bacterium]